MPGRFKDYIAVPKTNMYQSLHTTVFGDKGYPFEIQIRTWDMHKVADYGVAAHFAYKEKTNKISQEDKKIIWLRQTLQIQQELLDNTENMNKMKVELFGEEVFVFTPKGDIKALPKGSTPIDFAYSIHQKIAEKMVGAKINSKLVPLSTKLSNTDVVEIITSQKAVGPSRDWIKNVKTTSARNKITLFLKKDGRELNIQKGREEFEREIKKQKPTREQLLNEKILKDVFKQSNFKTLDDCYENIGFGSITAKKVVNKLVDAYLKINSTYSDTLMSKMSQKNRKVSQNLVIVENINNCKVQFAKCCLPIPGDKIVGYITNANGVSIHRFDCPNLGVLDTKSRYINVSWQAKIKDEFSAKIKIKSNCRKNIITDIISLFNELKVKIIEMNTKVNDNTEMVFDIVVNILDIQEVQNIIRNIKKIDSVFEVKRVR
ncbi:MAG: TGS domain-containing protein, partial [Clostridia bacterium]